MPGIFFTADSHHGHEKIIQLEMRPFATIQEMDETLVRNWNEVVAKGDLVYHLGDFGMGPGLPKIIERLNGCINLICGNHDNNNIWKIRKMFCSYLPYHEITVDGQKIVLCHYPFRSWHNSHRGSWSLYGHCHGKVPSLGKSLDVGVMCHDWKPVSFERVKEIMAALPGFDIHDSPLDDDD